MSRELGAEPHPLVEKFGSVGRNSLDVFSPVREGRTHFEICVHEFTMNPGIKP